jgi:hypothetical protein
MPYLWTTTSEDIATWWSLRSNYQVSAQYARDGDNCILTITTNGVGSPLMALDVLRPQTSPVDVELDGSASLNYRLNGTALKVNSGSAQKVDITWNVNSPPVAVNDAYTVKENTVLTVAKPGVLANDSDADGDVLTAALVNGVSNGNLTLNTDGSFTYTPNANFTGNDSFTYRANDGKADSNIATVSITITEPTFGLDNGDSTWVVSPNIVNAFRFLNSVGTGTMNKLEMLFDNTAPTGKVRLGIYADQSGVPGSLLLDAGEVAVVNGWVSIDGLSLAVKSNTYYWLAFILENSNGARYQSGQPASSHYWMVYAYGALPSQFILSGAGSNNNQFVMRATVAIGS